MGTGFSLPAMLCRQQHSLTSVVLSMLLAGAFTICRGQEGPVFVAPLGTHFPRAGSCRAQAAHAAARSQQKAHSCCLASPEPLPSAVLLPLMEQNSHIEELPLFPKNTRQASG